MKSIYIYIYIYDLEEGPLFGEGAGVYLHQKLETRIRSHGFRPLGPISANQGTPSIQSVVLDKLFGTFVLSVFEIVTVFLDRFFGTTILSVFPPILPAFFNKLFGKIEAFGPTFRPILVLILSFWGHFWSNLGLLGSISGTLWRFLGPLWSLWESPWTLSRSSWQHLALTGAFWDPTRARETPKRVPNGSQK